MQYCKEENINSEIDITGTGEGVVQKMTKHENREWGENHFIQLLT